MFRKLMIILVLVANTIYVFAQCNMLPTYTSSPANCGEQQGSIDLNVVGGTPPYTYIWSDGSTSLVHTGLAAGTYTVTVTDAAGCTSVVVATVPGTPALNVDFQVTPTYCGSCDGAINLTISGGNAPYRVDWLDLPGAWDIEDRTNLCGGTYGAWVYSNDGLCKRKIIISVPTSLYAELSATEATCNDLNGQIVPTLISGTPPFTYTWSNGSTDSVLTNVGPGQYTVTIKDANNCTGSISEYVTSPCTVIIGGEVWADSNADGNLDVTETAGIGGVVVGVYPDLNNDSIPDAQVLASVVSGIQGQYQFEPLDTGRYFIRFTKPNGYQISSPPTGFTPRLDLTDGGLSLEHNCGIYSTAEIGNWIWVDANANGLQDAGEPGLQGVTINLYPDQNSDGLPDLGVPLASTISSANGFYQFVDLTPGKYLIQVELPLGYLFTNMNSIEFGSKIDPETGFSGTIELTSGEIDNTNDAGVFQLCSIGNFVWEDLDADGLQELGEPGILGVTVRLYQDANNDGQPDGPAIDQTVTDNLGNYLFSQLSPGRYVVQFLEPAGYDFSAVGNIIFNSTPLTGYSQSILLVSGGTNFTIDAGLYRNGNISGKVWEDLNGDGVQDPDEPGIFGVTVNMYFDSNGDGTPDGPQGATITSGIGGEYSMPGLVPDNYIIGFVQPNGYFFSPPNVGNDQTDSDANTMTGLSSSYSVVSNASLTHVDAGLYLGASVGDIVWADINGNGIQDAGELGLPGIEVVLYTDSDHDDYPDLPALSITHTNAIGLYSFSGLQPGYYKLQYVLPEHHYPIGTILDSLSFTASFHLTAGEVDGSKDLGVQVCTTDWDVSITPSLCGQTTGSIMLNVTGLTTSAYNWNNGTVGANNEDLAAGIYTVTVSDAACTLVRDFIVPDSGGPTFASFLVSTSCNPNLGVSWDLEVSGGTAPYTYTWSDGVNGVLDRSNLLLGMYSVTVTDVNGCVGILKDTVEVYIPMKVLLVGQNPTCIAPGTIVATVTTGGNAPFFYQWNTGATGANLTGITNTGTYTVTVTDALGCSVATSTFLFFQSGIEVLSNLKQPCTAQNNGAILLEIPGFSGAASFDWAHILGTQNPQNLYGLSPGIYTVTITVGAGCATLVKSYNLAAIPAYSVTSIVNPQGCDAHSADVQLSVNGGVGPFSYTWNNGSTMSNLVSVFPGTYTVTVSDANQCVVSKVVSVVIPPPLQVAFDLTPTSCNASTGAVWALVNGGVAPYQVNWSQGTTGFLLDNVIGGNYTCTVTDNRGCSLTAVQAVTHTDGPVIDLVSTNMPCDNLSAAKIKAFVTSGVGPFQYIWSQGATTDTLEVTTPGIYALTVTDALGCSNYAAAQVLPYQAHCSAISGRLWHDIDFDGVQSAGEPGLSNATVQLFRNQAQVGSLITGTQGDFEFNSIGEGGYRIKIVPPQGFLSTVTQVNGLALENNVSDYFILGPAESLHQFDVGYVLGNQVMGHIYHDVNENCAYDPAVDKPLINVPIQMDGSIDYYGLSDSLGAYRIEGIPGSYTLKAGVIQSGQYYCQNNIPISFPGSNDTVAQTFFAKGIYCPELQVSMTNGLLRRCFNNNFYHLIYKNNSIYTVDNVFIVVELDSFLTLVTSNQPFLDLGNNRYQFDLGTLNAHDSGTFWIRVEVSCNAVLGQTHCSSATIYPNQNCVQPIPQWSGALLGVKSQCQQDSLFFIIQNNGTGPMSNPLEYVIIEDGIMGFTQMLPPLPAGDSVVVGVLANGSTWRIEAEQEPFAPTQSIPVLSVEGCTTGALFSLGFVTQFPLNDADAYVDIECRQNIGSYDPNDKQAIPIGYGEEHSIYPGTALEYLIRFQNTGTDTAFTVVIRDTLSPWLDPLTIRPMGASHPFTFDLTGTGVAVFRFENILLPDSNINAAASNGFVQFSIAPRSDLPIKTQLHNSAAIYFDFNSPVITNDVWHTIDTNFLPVMVWEPVTVEHKVSVNPNPAQHEARVKIHGINHLGTYHLRIFDADGREVGGWDAALPDFVVSLRGFNNGVYWTEIRSGGVLLGNGKLVVNGKH